MNPIKFLSQIKPFIISSSLIIIFT